jgi:hypothetical protein
MNLRKLNRPGGRATSEWKGCKTCRYDFDEGMVPVHHRLAALPVFAKRKYNRRNRQITQPNRRKRLFIFTGYS